VWRNGAMSREREDGHALRSGDMAEYGLPADHQWEVGQQNQEMAPSRQQL
jgi:hypothetical protein